MNITGRPGTDEDLEKAQALACKLADITDGEDIDLVFGAVSLLVGSLFSTAIRSEYRVQAFEDFSDVVRKTVKESLT